MDQQTKLNPQFERTVLLLQGGGALGSYQAGVYEAIADARLYPDWIAGISIGAINSAIIAGNAPENRVERLREFWRKVTAPPLGPFGVPYNPAMTTMDDHTHRYVNQTRALGIMMLGAPGFFAPRFPPSYFMPSKHPETVSYYDVSKLRSTLEQLVDFDRINSHETRFSVGAVNVKTGNFVYFDNATDTIRPEHVIASGSLPPGFPATEIDGEYYWDGGIVSNTPLQWVLDQRPRKDTLALQVDLWSAHGELPRDVLEAETRMKDIRYSSRTRAATDQYRHAQKIRLAVADLIKHLPEKIRDTEDVRMLAAEADDKVCTIVQLIYDCKIYEGLSKDYEFSRRTMEEHWAAGHRDALKAIKHPNVFNRPTTAEGVRVFDFAKA